MLRQFLSFESRPADISYVSSRGRGFSLSENAGKDGGRGKREVCVRVCDTLKPIKFGVLSLGGPDKTE